MRRVWMCGAVFLCWTGTLSAQALEGPVEIPLRLEAGRMIVTVDAPGGATYDFVLGLGETVITEAGAQRLGTAVDQLTLGGVPVDVEHLVTAPAVSVGLEGKKAIGVIGGLTLNKYDALIDVPNARLVLKPVGRSVRWEGVPLTNPVFIEIFHEYLIRVDVEAGGTVLKGLLDLSGATMEVNEPLRSALRRDGTTLGTFRMGYGTWTDLPAAVTDSPIFGRWTGPDTGFVIVGSPVAHDCAIAISWFHSEMRTCRR